MDANTHSVKDVFGHEKRYAVPLFQRPYVWRKETQWEPLWDDVRVIADRLLADPTQNIRAHFLGAIVLEHQKTPLKSIETRLVIDGQQRLTTIQIMLTAFHDVVAGLGAEKHQRALEKLVRNEDPLSENEDDVYKVWPTNVDRDHFRRVMRLRSPAKLKEAYDARPSEKELGHPIADAYLYFFSAVADWIGPTDRPEVQARIEMMFATMRDCLRFVVIDLGENDDPQLIFETLNARGTPLLPADLVKNFLLLRAQEEKADINKVYEKYWRPFDENADYWRSEIGRGHAMRARVDIFLQHYLTIKKASEVQVAHLYPEYRIYAGPASTVSAATLLEDLHQYSKIYATFDEKKSETPEALFFEHLAEMDVTTAHPFLLELFKRFAGSPEIVRTILTDLDSFLTRRLICQLNTRGYNRLFVDLIGELNKASATPVDPIRAFLLSSQAENARWPTNKEFQDAWLAIPAYRVLKRGRVRMILEGIERALHSDKSEKISFKDRLTVEHIMPRSWEKHWPLPAGQSEMEARSTRENLIHTFGNLTLLTKKLNPSVSNSGWEKKKQAMKKYSRLNLNVDLDDHEAWDESRILARSNALFAIAKAVWPQPA